MPRHLTDLAGQRFGRLLVVRYVPERRDWLCSCDCGKETFVRVTALRRSSVVSCGCFRRERPSPTRTHGRTLTPEYRSWRAMKRRCLKPTASQYGYYGGRGITVCARWRDSFEAFLADMGEKPSTDYSLDRIDNDGNYSPANCRWASRSQQVTNSRTAAPVTYKGITDTIEGWSKRLGLRSGALRLRLGRGWSVERALAVPMRITRR